MKELEQSIQTLVAQYGYHAVPFALLTDPAGIPWGWIFLMLLAEEGRKNVTLMLCYGFAVLMVFDHILYWMGALGGPKLVRKICAKKPDWSSNFAKTRDSIHRHGALAVIFGRYLPLVGRWMGLGAGLSGMNYVKFSIYDAIGAGISAFGFGLIAHFVGRKTIEHPSFYPIVVGSMVVITVLSVLGGVWAWWKKRQTEASSEEASSVPGL